MGKAKQVSLCAVLTAMALALSLAERVIPMPLPGMKLGLANVVTLVALSLLGTRQAAAILVCRCVLGAVFGGGITGLAFSLCGGFLALGTMLLACRGRFSVFGISMLGAAAHNIGQILAAMALMGSVYVGAYLSLLLLVAMVTGLLTGGLCAGVLRILRKTGGGL